MKYFIYNCFLFVTILLFILFIYYNTIHNAEEKVETVENFTPYMRHIYRPYIRKARIIGEGFYVDQKINITNLFRKFGII